MTISKKRKLDLLVISDVHLGTYGCKAKELLNYLKTVKPKVLVLNGDIIDIWQFSKRYFPKSHMKVIKYITALLSNGTKVYYVTGNHDEMLRKFVGFRLGKFEIVNKLLLDLDGIKTWVFHGDVFDVIMKHSKWLARLGGIGYGLLIIINLVVNFFSEILGYGRISLSKRIKNSVKRAVKHINDFEQTAAEIAIRNGYNYVVCGHVHQPQNRTVTNKEGKEVVYLNSGDWIENLTALEYIQGTWSIYSYFQDSAAQEENKMNTTQDPDLSKAETKNKELFAELLEEFQFNQHIRNGKIRKSAIRHPGNREWSSESGERHRSDLKEEGGS